MATGVLPPAAAGGAGVPGFDMGPAFAGAAAGGGGGASMYFKAKSETMSRLSETFAFNWNDESCGRASTTSPVMFVNA